MLYPLCPGRQVPGRRWHQPVPERSHRAVCHPHPPADTGPSDTASKSFNLNALSLALTYPLLRHLARKHNLYGSSEKEAGQVDMVMDGVNDLLGKVAQLVYYKNLVSCSQSEEAARLHSFLRPPPTVTSRPLWGTAGF